ncbi:enoyl-CoA hydratase/isomerase family protein [Bradyrhizobium tropiciagri]|uniref:enoyl-CoA hydratase/isomerase family protein n=1 Tax=Bradyrhizobium tropiciagri TaxID=312253 RepID=UPI00067D38ED|nr:enoyl-CoA hydratase-related protein [Bradyrhizobium tropiciagri]
MIDLAFQDEFAVLTLNRPAVLNALGFAQLEILEGRLDEIEASDARCVVITGAGSKAFSAGADVSELAGRSVEQELDGTLHGQRIISRLETLRQPSVALVNGYALGGGCELCLACTFRLATPSAAFGLPEVRLGLVPGYGGTQRLSRLVGSAIALEAMLTGRMIGAEEALKVGLVSRILADDDPLEAAKAFARGFTSMSLTAMRFIRDAVRLGADRPLQDGLAIEAQASTLSYRSADGQEGLRAFLEKRAPRFQDR